MVNKDIYLYELDISSKGAPIYRSNLTRFLFDYLLIANHVYIQASAPLKRIDVYQLYLQFNQCFKSGDVDKEPLCSLVLSPEIYSYSDYINRRIDVLSEGVKIKLISNKEYISYQKSNAIEVAKKLDRQIPLPNIKRRNQSADKLFRHNVKKLFENELFVRNQRISYRTQKIIINFSEQLEFFQTFNIENLLKEQYNICSCQNIIGSIRKMYHIANMEAVQSTSSIIDFHFCHDNILVFFETLGINIFFENQISLTGNTVFKIRKNESFKYLKELYFRATSHKSIEVLCETIKHSYIPYYSNKIINALIVPAFIGFCFDPDSTVLKNMSLIMSTISLANIYTSIPVEVIKKVFENTISKLTDYDSIKIAEHKSQLTHDLREIII